MNKENVKGKIIDCLNAIGISLFIEDDEDIDIQEYINDSLTFISFIVELENAFGFEFEEEYLDWNIFHSLDALTDYIFQYNESM